MVVPQEGNLFALLGSDVEDDPEFVLPSKKKDSKAEKKVVKAREEKTEAQLRGLKAPVDTRAKRIENQSRVGAKPSAVQIKNNNLGAEAKAGLHLLNTAGAPKADATQQNNPTYMNRSSNSNGYNQRNSNGYSQRNDNGYKGGFRNGNSYQQRNRGNDGGYRSGAGDARHERKISGEEISGDQKIGQDNYDNSWCYVGPKGRLSKIGSVSEDMNSTKSESIQGSEYSSRTLERQSSVGQPVEDSQSVQATSDQGDAQVIVGEEGSKKTSMGKSTEGRRDMKPKEEQKPEKPTFTLKEYEAKQAEKRKALDAIKRSQGKKVEDKEFESFKLVIGKKGKKKNQSVEVVDKANTNKERTENKAPKAIRITDFVVPDKDELLIERPDGTWHLVKQQRRDNGRGGNERPGRVIRQRRFPKGEQEEKKGGHEAGNDEQKKDNSGSDNAVPVPPLDEQSHFPGLC